MPVLTLDLTISAGEVTRIVAAYQSAANTSINGTATQAQVLAYIKATIRQQIVDTVKNFEKSVAVAAVADPIAISPT